MMMVYFLAWVLRLFSSSPHPELFRLGTKDMPQRKVSEMSAGHSTIFVMKVKV
jgi:hypothetical protein